MNFASRRNGTLTTLAAWLCATGIGVGTAATVAAQPSITLNKLGTYASGIFAQGGAEIVSYDPGTKRLFVVNAQDANVDVLDIADPTLPVKLFSIDVTPYGAVANSVDVHDGVVAVAVEDADKQANGRVVFFNTAGTFLSQVEVGALPDMLTFSRNGRWVLVANEGEPNSDYTVDPNGSVSIIDLEDGAASLTQGDVRSIDFTSFNNKPLDGSIRIFGPNATVAQDLEPEYITISHDSKMAWVSLQENNALAIIDIKKGKVKSLVGLGFKNHNRNDNSLDPSDRDNAIKIGAWPVNGMYLPDGLASYDFHGETYILSANEGDVRDYDGFSEEKRVRDVTLDSATFPNRATLRDNANLGRLKITSTLGDTDGDGDYDKLYSFGARSFSIWSESGCLVFDSGDDFERILAAAEPANFNSDNEENGSFDTRSDDKGPEPEGVVVGKAYGDTYAFIGLERQGGVMVYDISNPCRPRFIQYINNRDFDGDAESGTAGDLGPEGLKFISADNSPTGDPLLVVSNEVSGTTTIYGIEKNRRFRKENGAGEAEVIGNAMLGQNYPNPFSAATTIPFTLPAESRIALSVIALDGRTVATLANEVYPAGSHEVAFTPENLPAGSYLYRLEVDGIVRELRQLTFTR